MFPEDSQLAYIPQVILRRREVQPLEVFYKKGDLKNVPIFLGQHLCLSLFLIKFQASRSSHYFYFSKETPPHVLSCGCCEILKKTYFEEHLLIIASEKTDCFSHSKDRKDTLKVSFWQRYTLSQTTTFSRLFYLF